MAVFERVCTASVIGWRKASRVLAVHISKGRFILLNECLEIACIIVDACIDTDCVTHSLRSTCAYESAGAHHACTHTCMHALACAYAHLHVHASAMTLGHSYLVACMYKSCAWTHRVCACFSSLHSKSTDCEKTCATVLYFDLVACTHTGHSFCLTTTH